MEVPLVLLLVATGFIVLGTIGFKTYAKQFYSFPKETITLDLIIALMKGPGSVLIVFCAFMVIAGLVLLYHSVSIIILLVR